MGVLLRDMGVGASSVNCYIKSIPRDALLTKEEEIHLANVMRNGSDREKREARERFITANLPLVVFIAKRYMRDGVCFGDIVQQGNLGLIRAVDKFDPDKGYRFSTYATSWIRQFILRTLQDLSKPLHVPDEIAVKISALRTLTEESWMHNHRSLTVDEITEKLSVTREVALAIIGVYKSPFTLSEMTVSDKTNDVYFGNPDDLFGNYVIGADEEYLRYSTDDNDSKRLYEIVESTLNEREKRLIGKKYGLFGYTKETVKTISTDEKMSYSTTTSTIRKALLKLKNCKFSDELGDICMNGVFI